MHTNRYDREFAVVNDETGVNWDESSKVHLFARFMEDCEDHVVTFAAWQEFLREQAREEAGPGEKEDDAWVDDGLVD
jgi:hypothetical protein